MAQPGRASLSAAVSISSASAVVTTSVSASRAPSSAAAAPSSASQARASSAPASSAAPSSALPSTAGSSAAAPSSPGASTALATSTAAVATLPSLAAESISIAHTTPTTPVPAYSAIAPTAPKGAALSPGAIGGIVGGAVGGVAVIVLAFFIWRMCRGRGEKLPPPPPRDVIQSIPRHGPPSRYGGGSRSRTSSVAGRRPLSFTPQSPMHENPFRGSAAYYATYPASSTPSVLTPYAPDLSPRFAYTSASPSLSSAVDGATPAAGFMLAPGLSSLRDGSSSSDSASGTSDDREVRPQGSQSHLSAAGSAAGSADAVLRPVTPSERSALQDSSISDSQSTSPRASTVHLPSNRSGSNLSQTGLAPRYAIPRSPSSSMPHKRNSMILTMPRPLSVHSVGSSHAATDPAPPMPNQILYTPRTSMYSAYNSHRNSYQSARSYTEFGARAPRTSSHHQRMPSGSYAPNRDASVTESPTDVDDYSTASGQSSAQSSQVGSNRRRQGHAIV